MKREILFVQQVAMKADAFYGDGERFGQWAAHALGSRHRSQMTGLESVANSSLKVSDVLDYLKKQTARAKAGAEWRYRGSEQQELGPEMIAFIREILGRTRDEVCASVAEETKKDASEQEKQETHVSLIREFVRQVAAQYEMGVIRRDT